MGVPGLIVIPYQNPRPSSTIAQIRYLVAGASDVPDITDTANQKSILP